MKAPDTGANPTPVEAPSCQNRPPSACRQRILLAEDTPTNRHAATCMLTRMGHIVEAVDDGAKAARAALSGDYDLILMDVMMPEVDGIAATRMIRAGASPRCHTRIIGVTANGLVADRVACESAGMDGFITKPVTMERLRVALTRARPSGHPDQAGTSHERLLNRTFLGQLADEIGSDGAAEVVRVFLEEGSDRMAAIQQAMADGTIQKLRREAHALAGAARNVGLTEVGDLAYDLQKTAERSGPCADGVEALAASLAATLPLASDWAREREDLASTSARFSAPVKLL